MKFKKFSALVLSLLLFSSGTSVINAQSNDAATIPDECITYQGEDIIITSPDYEVDKEAYMESVDEYLDSINGNNIKTRSYYYIDGYDSSTHNGSTLYSQFDSTIDWDFIKSSTISGKSKISWVGQNPFYADKITLTDTFKFTGIAVSVNISKSPGMGWSASGGTATWQESLDNEWTMTHNYSNVACSGYDLYIKQTTSGDFKFGRTYYTVTALASKFL